MKTSQKVHPMGKKEMKRIREEMRLNLRELTAVMKGKYRTLQNYEGGQRPIPQEFADQLRAEEIKHRQIRAEIYAGIDARLDREYPNGIIPEM